MRPIEIKITSYLQQSPQEICADLLDTDRWSEFRGYSILPGIKSAQFETKTPDVLGSRIRVCNTDGSAHVEEIIIWDVEQKVGLKFQDFTPPLSYFATHFVETWDFRRMGTGTQVTRTMALHPKGVLGWLMLSPISRLMKKAFEQNLAQMQSKEMRT